MLCASNEAGYVHEPFNPNRSPGWFLEPLPFWFMHVTPANESPYLEGVRRMLRFQYPTARAFAKTRSLRLLAMNAQQAASAFRSRVMKKRLLLKDPLALFSAEWLATRFGMRVVVLVRHPASFVSSIKQLNWGFDYERNWLAQPLLMKNLLPGYEESFSGYRGEVDLVGEGIVVWNAMNEVVSGYRDRHPDWSVLRYEDVAGDPVATFRSLYEKLELTWSDDVEGRIAAHSSGDNPSDVPPRGRHEIRRDSRAAAGAWRTRLSPEEIDRIRVGTEAVWPRFYSAAEWEAGGRASG